MSLKNYLILCLISIFLIGCDDGSKTKLYVLECGKILVKDISLFSPNVDVGVSKELANSCYLVVHQNGTLMWDTGLSDTIYSFKNNYVESDDGQFLLKVEKTFLSQLGRIEILPSDIDYLAFSHVHFDHTGNANLFTKSTLILQREEYSKMFFESSKNSGFDPESYMDLATNNVIKLSGDYDVFGDGQVIIKRATGHTAGHQVLYVDLEDTGPVVISGDLYHFAKNRRHHRIPSFNFDRDQTFKSMIEIERFVAEKGAQMWIQHDLQQNQLIKHVPHHYE